MLSEAVKKLNDFSLASKDINNPGNNYTYSPLQRINWTYREISTNIISKSEHNGSKYLLTLRLGRNILSP
jgi:hypothetical protein